MLFQEASNYGWENTTHVLEPMGMTNPIAPEDMQKLVSVPAKKAATQTDAVV